MNSTEEKKQKKKIGFLSSDIKNYNSTEAEPKHRKITLDSENVDEELAPFYQFINKVLDAENLVILAGSGTSLTFKEAPSMGSLWKSCEKNNKTLFESVLSAIQYNDHCKQGNLEENIELLLSLCDSYVEIGNLPDTQNKEVKSFLKEAKNTILSETNFTEKIENENDWTSHNKFIRTVARRSIQQQRLKLFTTNYDLAFEHAASNVGFVVIDGFEFSNPSYFNPMWFNYDIVNRSHTKRNEGTYIPNVFQLYKIHGSVDWRKINGRVRKLGANSQGDPVFIYPSSSKYQNSYNSPYLDMMTSFLEVVKQPKTAVLCLGFGFNDKHINNGLTMALRTNPEFMLMVATKDLFKETSSFNREIQKLLTTAISHGDGRIAMLDSTFEQFSALLPERRSSTPEEELFKAFEKITANMK